MHYISYTTFLLCQKTLENCWQFNYKLILLIFFFFLKVGLLGEKLQIYTDFGSRQVEWRRYGSSTHQPLTWYKVWKLLILRNSVWYSELLIHFNPHWFNENLQTLFDAPPGNDPVALNLVSMGKGEAWVNGQSIGRYWVSFLTPKGSPSQTW